MTFSEIWTTVYISQLRNWQQTQESILLNFNLAKKWVYWGYLQRYECGIAYGNMDHSVEVAPPKAHSSMGGVSLTRASVLELCAQHASSQTGWGVPSPLRSAHCLCNLGREVTCKAGVRNFLGLWIVCFPTLTDPSSRMKFFNSQSIMRPSSCQTQK